MTTKEQMALETDSILRDMSAECSSGDDLISLRNSQKLFRSITAATNVNKDKIEKILAGTSLLQCKYTGFRPNNITNRNRNRSICGFFLISIHE